MAAPPEASHPVAPGRCLPWSSGRRVCPAGRRASGRASLTGRSSNAGASAARASHRASASSSLRAKYSRYGSPARNGSSRDGAVVPWRRVARPAAIASVSAASGTTADAVTSHPPSRLLLPSAPGRPWGHGQGVDGDHGHMAMCGYAAAPCPQRRWGAPSLPVPWPRPPSVGHPPARCQCCRGFTRRDGRRGLAVSAMSENEPWGVKGLRGTEGTGKRWGWEGTPPGVNSGPRPRGDEDGRGAG